MIKWSKKIIRYFLSILIYFPLNFPFIFTKKTSKNRFDDGLAILKIDMIGDYILFRNFLQFVKQSIKYENFKLTVIGNSAWKDLAKNYENESVDKFIWINRNKFRFNIFYRIKTILEIRKYNYNTIINPNYSRSFNLDDFIVKYCNAKNKIGIESDSSNSYNWQLNLSRKYYHNLLTIPNKIDFEFHKNKYFFEKILNQTINIKIPRIQPPGISSSPTINRKYCCLFLGGRKKYKKWNVNNYASLAETLYKKYSLLPVLIGGKSENNSAVEFIKNYPFTEIQNLVNKTSLLELIDLLNSAEIIISNDSGVAHIAAALNKRVVVISNGKHFRRFLPYPDSIKLNVLTLYPDSLDNDILNSNIKTSDLYLESVYDINEISIDKVFNKIVSTYNLES